MSRRELIVRKEKNNNIETHSFLQLLKHTFLYRFYIKHKITVLKNILKYYFI